MERWMLIAVFACAGCGAGPPLTADVIGTFPVTVDPTRDEANDLTIRVRYHDANGDLGGGVAEVHDCRSPDVVTRLELPPIASAEAIARGVPIEGELALLVPDIGQVPAAGPPPACTKLGVGAVPAGHAIFCVILTDAARLTGQGDCTGPIAIAPGT